VNKYERFVRKVATLREYTYAYVEKVPYRVLIELMDEAKALLKEDAVEAHPHCCKAETCAPPAATMFGHAPDQPMKF
jgi:hypothetical protein